MIGGKQLLEQLEAEAKATAGGIATRFSVETRPRIAELLTEAGIVAIRRANGEDTQIAETALAASLANVTLQERSQLQLEARELAFRALVAVVAAAV